MEIALTPEQEALIQQAIEEGRFQTPEDAVKQAMSRWEDRERELLELLMALDEAEDDFKHGRYVEVTPESLPGIKAEILRNAGIGVNAAAK